MFLATLFIMTVSHNRTLIHL